MREEEKREKMSHRKQLWLEMNQGRQQNKRIERERNDVEEKTEKKRRRNVDPGERVRERWAVYGYRLHTLPTDYWDYFLVSPCRVRS